MRRNGRRDRPGPRRHPLHLRPRRPSSRRRRPLRLLRSRRRAPLRRPPVRSRRRRTTTTGETGSAGMTGAGFPPCRTTGETGRRVRAPPLRHLVLAAIGRIAAVIGVVTAAGGERDGVRIRAAAAPRPPAMRERIARRRPALFRGATWLLSPIRRGGPRN